MDKLGFLIIAHKNPLQLRKLVESLEHPQVAIFIHIDKKQDILPFKEALSNLKIQWVPRVRSQWGSIGMVKAILNGFDLILKDNSIQRVTLLSGMDYPLKPISKVYDFFDKNRDTNFIDIVSFENSGWSVEKKMRIKKYYFFWFNKLFEYPQNKNNTSVFRSILNLLLSFFLKKQRKFPKSLVPYGGWVWFSLIRKTVKEIIVFNENSDEFINFSKRCLSSDEFFFHTILAKLNPELKNVAPSVTYAKWQIGDTPHPETLNETHFEELSEVDHLFARKFDESIYPGVLDKMKKEMHLN